MVGPTQSFQFLIGQDQRVRREPDQETANDGNRQILDVTVVTNRTVTATHATPEVVICRQEQSTDQNRLDDEKPGKNATH